MLPQTATLYEFSLQMYNYATKLQCIKTKKIKIKGDKANCESCAKRMKDLWKVENQQEKLYANYCDVEYKCKMDLSS